MPRVKRVRDYSPSDPVILSWKAGFVTAKKGKSYSVNPFDRGSNVFRSSGVSVVPKLTGYDGGPQAEAWTTGYVEGRHWTDAACILGKGVISST
jgi:hypothetical protein